MDEFEKFYSQTYNNLVMFNNSILLTILKLLKFNCNVKFTKEFIAPGKMENDFRFTITPKQDNSSNIFDSYTQVFSDRHLFVANLSILDLIFNLGPEARSYLIKVVEKL